MGFAFILAGIATPRWRERYFPFHVCFVLMLASLAGLILARGLDSLWLPFALIGFAGGFAYSASAYYSMTSPDGRGAMMGTHEMLLSGGNLLGPLYAGAVLAITSTSAWGLAAMLPPLVIVWVAIILLTNPKLKK
jgi:hypothetical protein